MDAYRKKILALLPKFIVPQQPTKMPTPPEASEQAQHPEVAPWKHMRSHAGNTSAQADYNSSNSSSTVSDETMFDDGVDSGSTKIDLAKKLPAGWSHTGKRKRAGSSDCSGSDETAVNSGLESSPNLELAIVDRKFRDLGMLADVCAQVAGGRILVDDDEIGIKYVKEEYCKGRKLNDEAGQLYDDCNNNIKVFKCKLCDKKFSSHQALGGHVSSHKKNKTNNNMDRDQSNSAGISPVSAEDNKVELQKLYPTVSHQCEVCGNSFPTGQALGGHKRKHYNGPPEAPAKPSQQNNARRHLEIDLNETPSMEDEDGRDEPSLLLKLN